MIKHDCFDFIVYSLLKYKIIRTVFITLAFECDDHTAKLTIRDDVKYFAPDQVEAPDIDANWEERQIGGVGIYLVKELMDHVSYNKDENNTNVLLLEKILNPKGSTEE